MGGGGREELTGLVIDANVSLDAVGQSKACCSDWIKIGRSFLSPTADPRSVHSSRTVQHQSFTLLSPPTMDGLLNGLTGLCLIQNPKETQSIFKEVQNDHKEAHNYNYRDAKQQQSDAKQLQRYKTTTKRCKTSTT